MKKPQITPDPKTATHLEPDDGLTFLRFGRLQGRAQLANSEAARLSDQARAAVSLAAEHAAKAVALIAPVRGKYALGDGDQIDDETFEIRRAAAK